MPRPAHKYSHRREMNFPVINFGANTEPHSLPMKLNTFTTFSNHKWTIKIHRANDSRLERKILNFKEVFYFQEDKGTNSKTLTQS